MFPDVIFDALFSDIPAVQNHRAQQQQPAVAPAAAAAPPQEQPAAPLVDPVIVPPPVAAPLGFRVIFNNHLVNLGLFARLFCSCVFFTQREVMSFYAQLATGNNISSCNVFAHSFNYYTGNICLLNCLI
jgi:hypothetical protein